MYRVGAVLHIMEYCGSVSSGSSGRNDISGCITEFYFRIRQHTVVIVQINRHIRCRRYLFGRFRCCFRRSFRCCFRRRCRFHIRPLRLFHRFIILLCSACDHDDQDYDHCCTNTDPFQRYFLCKFLYRIACCLRRFRYRLRGRCRCFSLCLCCHRRSAFGTELHVIFQMRSAF